MERSFLRWVYTGGRPNRVGKALNRFSVWLYAAGVWPSRLVALDVVGRRSGRVISFPLVMVTLGTERYLVAMLGSGTNWVLNLAAADGNAVLRHGRREPVRLEVVPVDERPSILRRYLDIAPGARPHIPVGRHDPVERFRAVAESIPVFRVIGPGL